MKKVSVMYELWEGEYQNFIEQLLMFNKLKIAYKVHKFTHNSPVCAPYGLILTGERKILEEYLKKDYLNDFDEIDDIIVKPGEEDKYDEIEKVEE